MFWIKLPKVLFPSIFQFLTTRDMVRFESTSFASMQLCRTWFGDAQSQRIRPLMIRGMGENISFPDILVNTYLPDLILWSLAFRHVINNRHQRPNPKRKRITLEDHKNIMSNGKHLEDDMQTDLPSEVIHYLFTSSTFRNDKMSKQPSNEQAWQNTIAQINPYFYFLLDGIYDLGTRTGVSQIVSWQFAWEQGLAKMANWSDRHKLMFMEQAATRNSKVSQDILSIIRLSIKSLSLVLPSRGKMALRFCKYALWTVWGPYMEMGNTRENKDLQNNPNNPILHPTQLPPTQPMLQPNQMIYFNMALEDNIPLIQSNVKLATLQTMYQLRAVHCVRWYLNETFQSFVDIVSDSSNHPLLTINIFRVKHIHAGQSLQHRLSIYPQQIHIDYIVNNIATNESTIVFTAKYDPMIPTVQEPPELMCWKYLPIDSVECHFACHIVPTLQERSFVNRMNPKILLKQQQHVENMIETRFWSSMGIPSPAVHAFAHPKHCVVNNCIWNVFYSCL